MYDSEVDGRARVRPGAILELDAPGRLY
jgi:hypothetical protein